MKIPDQPNAAIEGGSWAPYQDAEFLISYAGNMKFQRAMARLQKPFKRKIEKGEMDPADQKNILIKAIAEAILLDWKRVEAEFNRENAIKLLTNDEEFREFVMEYAMSLQNFRQEEMEHEGES